MGRYSHELCHDTRRLLYWARGFIGFCSTLQIILFGTSKLYVIWPGDSKPRKGRNSNQVPAWRAQGESFQAEMVRQARERLEAKEAAKRKRAAGSRYRREEAEEEDAAADSESEADAARAQRRAAAAKSTKRAKPRLIF